MSPGSLAPAGAVADELVDRAAGELPALAALGARERLLAAAWLASLRAACTRRAYFGDRQAWLHWLSERGVDELTGAAVADVGTDTGHRVVHLLRKGGCKATVPVPPTTWAAVEAYLADRAARADIADWRGLEGLLVATAGCGRLRQSHLWELLGRAAGIECWAQLSPHSLRRTAFTLALDAGVSLRDVQDYAGHKDPRTTGRYARSRDTSDRNAVYTPWPPTSPEHERVG
jgi:integrase